MTKISFREKGTPGIWQIVPEAHRLIDDRLYRFVVELEMGTAISLHRDVMAPSFAPTELHFAFGRQHAVKNGKRVFGCPVLYGQPENRILFDVKWLDRKPRLGNVITFAQALQLCDTLLQQLRLSGGESGNVRKIYLASMGQPITFDTIAMRLNTSTRTLRRKLQQKGTSFRRLIDELNSQVAIKYVRETDLTVEEIAFVMGFGRYYLSQALLQHRPEAVGSLPRIAAPAIEALVSDRIAKLQSGSTDEKPDSLAARAAQVTAMVRRVEVGARKIAVVLDRAKIDSSLDALRHRLDPADAIEEANNTLTLTVVIRLKTWGGETVIEGPHGGPAVMAAHLDRNLVDAVVKAHRWRAMLASGEAKSFRAIARRAGCTEGYVRQIVDLAFLAPDITAAILGGAQPRHLTVDRLVRQTIPLIWDKQRRLFGLAAKTNTIKKA